MLMLKKFFYSSAGRQSLVTASANLLSAGLMAVALILLGRSMGPADFGIFSVSVSLMLILNQVINAGFSQLIPRFVGNWYQRPKRQEAFLAHVLYWQKLLALILVAITLLFLPSIAKLINYPHPQMIVLSVAGAVFFAIYNYLYFVFVAKQQFAKAGLLNVSQALLKAVALIAIIYFWQSNLLAVTVTYYLALLISALVFLVISKDKILFKPQVLEGQLAKKVNQFWLHSAIAALSIVLIDNLDVLLVQRQLSEYSAGLYAGAVRIAMFMSLIGVSIETVFNSRVARYKNKRTLRTFLKKSQILIILSLMLSLVFLPLSKYLISYTLGVDYLAATGILQLLMVNVFLTLLVLPLVAIFYAIDRPRYFSTVGIVRIVIIFALSIWLLPKFGAQAVAASRIVATGVVYVYSLFVVRKELG